MSEKLDRCQEVASALLVLGSTKAQCHDLLTSSHISGGLETRPGPKAVIFTYLKYIFFFVAQIVQMEMSPGAVQRCRRTGMKCGVGRGRREARVVFF